MNKTSRLVLKNVWILMSVSAFLFPLFTAAVDNDFYYATDNMLFGMVLISFPANFLFFFFMDDISHSVLKDFHPLIYFSLWLMLFVAGYLQWCWAIPRIFAERKIIKLNIAPHKLEESELRIEERQPAVALPQWEERREIRIFRVGQFDEQGRTPLERVIRDRAGASPPS